MRKWVIIVLLALGAFAFEQMDTPALQAIEPKNEVADIHDEMFVCAHRNNSAAETPSSVEVPLAQIRTINGPRTHTYRAPHIAATGHFYTTSNYVVAHFIHRLGTFVRAVDFYLYTLCQLRL
jgi:hypothetical protein